ncbi:MAG: histidine kinase dimerization/phospho-acceptor domain-containing protein [Polyangiaceae bacterium]
MSKPAGPQLRPGSLRTRVALWMAGAMIATLTLLGSVAYVLIVEEELREGTGESHDEITRETRRNILKFFGLVGPFALLLSSGGAYLLARRLLRPIDDVIHAATMMSSEDLARRLPVPAGDDELRRLVESLNGLFARLERGYAAQATFAADASHELRTPLAVITAELEVALRRPRSEAEWRESANAALTEAQRASRLVDALLRHARAGIASRRREPIDVRDFVERAAERQALAAEHAGLSLVVTPPQDTSAHIEGDADALDAALGSLLDNAIRYTPRTGQSRSASNAAARSASAFTSTTRAPASPPLSAS